VDADALEIRLRKPDADLPRLLAQPAFCAVPEGTPMIAGGLPFPLPSAGPYYVATRSPTVVVLKRNPNYHGPRSRALEAIVYHLNVAPGTAIAQLRRGKIDHIQVQDEPLFSPTSAAARSSGPRYRRPRSNWTEGLALNTRRPLFSAAKLRLAVAYAIDRRALASAGGGPDAMPTSSIVSPSQRANGEAQLFPLRPDLARARRLARTRRARAVLAVITDDNGTPYEQSLIGLLRRQLGVIGLRLSVLPIRQSIVADQPEQFRALLARADLAIASANNSQASDPVEYLRQLGEQYLTPADRARLERIGRLASPGREQAADALARTLERESVYI
jgi:peptide/nickel transport system substrate-binding protein